jgi:hypothetical protein
MPFVSFDDGRNPIVKLIEPRSGWQEEEANYDSG